MSTPTTEPAGQVLADPPAAAPAAATEATESAEQRLARVEKELSEARKEAAKYLTTLRSQEQQQQEAEAQRLKEAGEFKALYEKEQLARAALEAQVAAATRKQQQIEAATAAGLPLDMATRLIGDTPEALLADAQAMAVHMRPAGAPATGATNPAGSHGQQPPAKFDPANPPRLSSIAWKT